VAASGCVLLGAATSSQAAPAPEPSSALVTDAHVNALGVLVFGVTGAFELGSGNWGAAARLRWVDSGLYARSTLPASADQSLAFSYGGALGARYYSAAHGALTGWFAGPALELVHTRIEDPRVAKIATVTSLVVPEIEAGYRWRAGSWLFDLGLAGGYAIVLSKGVENIQGGTGASAAQNSAANKPYASVLGDVGFYF
jgi:hypothetical protein